MLAVEKRFMPKTSSSSFTQTLDAAMAASVLEVLSRCGDSCSQASEMLVGMAGLKVAVSCSSLSRLFAVGVELTGKGRQQAWCGLKRFAMVGKMNSK